MNTINIKNITEWLQNWYLEQCDGNWEHENEIKIYTLDNPGWSIKVDLKDLDIEYHEIKWVLIENNEDDWFGYQVSNRIFDAAGDSSKLNLLIYIFKYFINNNRIDEEYFRKVLINLNDSHWKKE